MRVSVAETAVAESGADLVCVGLFEGDDLPEELAGAPGAGDAKGGYKKTALVHPESGRVLVVGLGERDDFQTERARVAAALGAQAARRLEAGSIAWALPEGGEADEVAAALVEGTVLADYRFDRFRSKSGDDDGSTATLESLELLGESGASLSEAAETARVGAEAANRARELQNLPSNVATPSFLAERAEEIAAAHDSVTVEVLGRDDFERLGMGGLLAVSAGTAEEPRLIVLRHAGGGGDGKAALGLVGKAVTFDSGGISIKPAARMQEMKQDMSGGAAVLEATAAIAELGLPLDLISLIPSTENMPSGTAVKPGDVITSHSGKTIEVINTDAEGRLILCDALSWARRYQPACVLDIAGTAYTDRDEPIRVKGPTGIGVRLFSEFVLARAGGKREQAAR